jgi:hypothetical protein
MRDFRRAFGVTSGILAALLLIPAISIVTCCGGTFAFMSFLAPHTPQQVRISDPGSRAEEYRLYRDMGDAGVEPLLARLPESAVYLENANLTDKQIGRMKACLKRDMPDWEREAMVRTLRLHGREVR